LLVGDFNGSKPVDTAPPRKEIGKPTLKIIMKFTWTIKELKEVSNKKFLETLITERRSDLSIYSPLSKKLQKVEQWLKNLKVDEKEK